MQQGFDTMITVNVCSADFPSVVFVQNLQNEGGCDSNIRITMVQSAILEPDTLVVHNTINTTDTLFITQHDTVIVDNYNTITLFDTVTLTDTVYVNDNQTELIVNPKGRI